MWLQANHSYVAISNLTYGASGAFAMSLWAKATSAEGPAFAYLVSHGSPKANNWGGSQVCCLCQCSTLSRSPQPNVYTIHLDTSESSTCSSMNCQAQAVVSTTEWKEWSFKRKNRRVGPEFFGNICV